MTCKKSFGNHKIALDKYMEIFQDQERDITKQDLISQMENNFVQGST